MMMQFRGNRIKCWITWIGHVASWTAIIDSGVEDGVKRLVTGVYNVEGRIGKHGPYIES